MMHQHPIFNFCLCLCLLLSLGATPPPQDDSTRIDQLIESMPLEQRVGQMFLVNLWGAELSDLGKRLIQAYAPGGVVLFKNAAGSPWAMAKLTNAMQQAAAEAGAGLPMFIAIDQEGGIISRLPHEQGFTTFPVPQALAATGKPDNAATAGQAIAEELRAVGINMNLAPVADLLTRRENTAIGRRAFGSAPDKVGEMVAAFIAGTQEAGILATAKHFPGHGDTLADSHTRLPTVEHDLERLQSVELVPFQHAVEAGVAAIMVAHLWLPALEPIENRPASLSYPVVTELLREKMGYEGLILTDALAMDAIDRQFSYGEASVLAIQAGVDMLAFGPVSPENQQNAIETVIAAVRAGEIPEARIDESLRRILETKARFGLLDWSPLDPDRAAANLNAEAHQQFVADLFPQAITLVKDDYGLLPLAPDRETLLVFINLYGDTAYECKARRPGMRSVSIPRAPGAQNGANVLGPAQWVDVIVVFADDAITNDEQAELIRALPPEKTAVVAFRSPYDLLAFPEVSTYLALYTPLPEARAALCDLLLGAVEPRGVLPVNLDELYPAGVGLQGFARKPKRSHD